MSYSPGEICENLNVPASTLRRWADRFQNIISPQPGEAGRHRQYTAADFETFRQIRDLAAKGHSLRSIHNILQVIPPGRKPEPDPEPEPPKSENQSDTTALMVVAVSRELGSHSAQIQSLTEQIALQNERLAALADWLALPWYKRVGKRPPVKY